MSYKNCIIKGVKSGDITPAQAEKQNKLLDDLKEYYLETKGLKRRVAMTVNQFLVAPAIIRQSNMVLTVSRRVAEKFRLDSVKVFPLPLPTNPLRLKIIWHKRSDANSGNKWIREKIINICKNI